MEQLKTKEIKALIYKKLRHGSTPSVTIREVSEQYNLSEGYIRKLVQHIVKLIKQSSTELSEDAKDYIISNLQSIIEDSLENNDRKSALTGLNLLSKITDNVNDKPQITINNLGFDFGTE